MTLFKRLGAMLMAVIMVLTMMPTVAWAADGPTVTMNTAAVTDGTVVDDGVKPANAVLSILTEELAVGKTFYVPIVLSAEMANFNAFDFKIESSAAIKYIGSVTNFVYNRDGDPEDPNDFAKALTYGTKLTDNIEASIVTWASDAVVTNDGTKPLFYAGFQVVAKSATGTEKINVKPAVSGTAGITMTGETADVSFVPGTVSVEKEAAAALEFKDGKTSYDFATLNKDEYELTAPGNDYYFAGWFTGLKATDDGVITVDADGRYILNDDAVYEATYSFSAVECRPKYDEAPESGVYNALWIHYVDQDTSDVVMEVYADSVTYRRAVVSQSSQLKDANAQMLYDAFTAVDVNGRVKLVKDLEIDNENFDLNIMLDLNGKTLSATRLGFGQSSQATVTDPVIAVDSGYGKGCIAAATFSVTSLSNNNIATVRYFRDFSYTSTMNISYTNVAVMENVTYNQPNTLAVNMFYSKIYEIKNCQFTAREFFYLENSRIGLNEGGDNSIHDCVLTQAGTELGTQAPIAYHNKGTSLITLGSNNKVIAELGYVKNGTTVHELVAIHQYDGTLSFAAWLLVLEDIRAEINADTQHTTSFYKVAPGGTVVNLTGITLYPYDFVTNTDDRGYLSFNTVYTIKYLDSFGNLFYTQYVNQGEAIVPPTLEELRAAMPDQCDYNFGLKVYNPIGWGTVKNAWYNQIFEEPIPTAALSGHVPTGPETYYAVYGQTGTLPANYTVKFTLTNDKEYTVSANNLDSIYTAYSPIAELAITEGVLQNKNYGAATSLLKGTLEIKLNHDVEDNTYFSASSSLKCSDIILDLNDYTLTSTHTTTSNAVIKDAYYAAAQTYTIKNGTINARVPVFISAHRNIGEEKLIVSDVTINSTDANTIFKVAQSSNVASTLNATLTNVTVDAPNTTNLWDLYLSKGNGNATVNVTANNCQFNVKTALSAATYTHKTNGIYLPATGSYFKMDAATKTTVNAVAANMTLSCTDETLTTLNQWSDGYYSYGIEPHKHVLGNPVWTWAEDYTATVTFTCTADDCDETVSDIEVSVTSETTDATETTDGKIVYTATATVEGKTYTDTKTKVLPATGLNVGGENVAPETDKVETTIESGKNSVEITNSDKLTSLESLKVTHENAVLKFLADALDSIADQAANGNVVISVETTNPSSETAAGRVSLTVKDAEGKEVAFQGEVEVSIPFTPAEGKKASDYRVFWVKDDDTREPMNTNVTTVDGKNYANFKTNHFSDWEVDLIAAGGYVAGLNSTTQNVYTREGVVVNVEVSNVDTNSTVTKFSAAEVIVEFPNDLLDLDTTNLDAMKVNGTLDYNLVANGTTTTLTIEQINNDRNFATDNFVLNFTAQTDGEATVKLTNAAFAHADYVHFDDAKGDLQEAAINPEIVVINIDKPFYNVELDASLVNGLEVAVEGEDYTFTLNKKDHYHYDVTATFGGNPVGVTGPDADGKYTIAGADITAADRNDKVVITVVETPDTYDVNITNKDGTTTTGTATHNKAYTFTLPDAQSDKYAINYAITIGGVAFDGAFVNGKEITIPGDKITDAIAIVITEKQVVFDVTVNQGQSGTIGGGTGENGTIQENDKVTLTITPEDGYDYEATATMNGQKLTVVKTVNADGTITFTVQEGITGDIEFTVTKILLGNVKVYQYLTLNADATSSNSKNMFLITYTGTLNGSVPYYGDNAMLWSEKYQAYAWLDIVDNGTLTDEEARNQVSVKNGTKLDVNYSMDVNKSGKIDAADAQFVYNMYAAKYSNFDDVSVAKFLAGDQNAVLNDGVLTNYGVDVNDATVIISAILAGNAK